MYRYLRVSILLSGLLLSVPSYAHHLAVIVAKDAKVDSVTSAELKKIMKSETKRWPNGNEVVVVLSKNSPATMDLLQQLWQMSEPAVRAFIAAHPNSIIEVDSDAELLKIVETKPGALGLVDVHAIHNNHVQVLKVDGKLPLEQGYLPH
jgi:ABC-type phosphate transport system substrate-binding protein